MTDQTPAITNVVSFAQIMANVSCTSGFFQEKVFDFQILVSANQLSVQRLNNGQIKCLELFLFLLQQMAALPMAPEGERFSAILHWLIAIQPGWCRENFQIIYNVTEPLSYCKAFYHHTFSFSPSHKFHGLELMH